MTEELKGEGRKKLRFQVVFLRRNPWLQPCPSQQDIDGKKLSKSTSLLECLNSSCQLGILRDWVVKSTPQVSPARAEALKTFPVQKEMLELSPS